MIHDDLIGRLQAVRARAQRARAEARQLMNQYGTPQETATTMVEREERARVPVEQSARSDARAKALVTLAAE
jgi:hypothetical protein